MPFGKKENAHLEGAASGFIQKFGKQTTLILAGIIVLIFVCSVFNTPSPEKELLDYVENRIPAVFLMEDEMLDQIDFGSISASTSGMKAIAKEIKQVILPGYKKMLKAAEGIRIHSEALKEIHRKYTEYLRESIEVYELMKGATDKWFILQSDYMDSFIQLAEAAERLEKAEALKDEYIAQVNAYCKELGIDSSLPE